MLTRPLQGQSAQKMRADAICLCRFAVIPLTEETGIIERVPQTHGLRHCCQDIYNADGTYNKDTANMLFACAGL